MLVKNAKAAWVHDAEFAHLRERISSAKSSSYPDVGQLGDIPSRRRRSMILSSIQTDYQKQLHQEACNL